MKRKRREAQSSTLSFMDCICCGFGAILLLFILTAKRQITIRSEESSQSVEAAQTLRAAIEAAEEKDRALETQVAALDPVPETTRTDLAELAAREERLAESVETLATDVAALRTATEQVDEPAALERPSADRSYLAGLQLRGPRILILLESSGSMLAESAGDALDILRQGTGAEAAKWLRAKAVVRSVLAALPKGTEAAIYAVNENTAPLSGSGSTPYFDPYENSALLSALERLDKLEASGGSDLAGALRAVDRLRPAPSSILYIGDGLPTAPSAGGSLSETDRVNLFRRAMAAQKNIPFNSILLPFEGDPAAAGLYWQMSARTRGITLVPDEDWPKVK